MKTVESQYVKLAQNHNDDGFETDHIQVQIGYYHAAVLTFNMVKLTPDGVSMMPMSMPKGKVVLEHMSRNNAKKIAAWNEKLAEDIKNKTGLFEHLKKFAEDNGVSIL